MALNFPDSPTLNQVYTDSVSGFSYQWDGFAWQSYSPAASSNIRLLDDISGSFDGTTTTFALLDGGVAVTPANSQQIRVTLGGIVQEPTTDYVVAGSNVVFSTAPGSGLSCSIVSLGPALPVDAPNSGIIFARQEYNPTGVQTSFTFTNNYTSGYLEVYHNGVKLVDGPDFTATNGSTFDLTVAAQNGDVVEAVAYLQTSLYTLGNYTNYLTVVNNATVGGILTATSAVVGSANTFTEDLVVNGDARITGILTIGTSSITLDGTNNEVNVGAGVTIHHTNGVQVGGNTLHSSGLTVNQLNVSGVVTATTFYGDGSALTGVTGTSLTQGNTTAQVVDTGSDGRFVVTTEGTEALRVDSSRRLLLGTSSAFSTSSNALVQAVNTSGGEIVIGRDFALGSGSTIGRLSFFTKPSAVAEAARIEAIADALHSGGAPTRLVFSTTAAAASSPTERMRITSDGQARVGSRIDINPDQDLSGSGDFRSVGLFNGASGAIIATNAFNQTGTINHMRLYNGNGLVGSITTAGSATAYNTSSDYRLKENVVALDGAADRLKQLKPSRFNFLADPDKTVDGFIAHEAQSVVPECVTGTKDEVEVWKEGENLPDGVSVGDNKLNEDGNTIPVYQGIDQSKLVPLLTAALQEALDKIDALQARLDAAGL